MNILKKSLLLILLAFVASLSSCGSAGEKVSKFDTLGELSGNSSSDGASVGGQDDTPSDTEAFSNGDTAQFPGVKLVTYESATIFSRDESSETDYIIALTDMDVKCKITFNLLVDGTQADTVSFTSAGEATLHAGVGRCILTAATSKNVTVDFTIERIAQD